MLSLHNGQGIINGLCAIKYLFAFNELIKLMRNGADIRGRYSVSHFQGLRYAFKKNKMETVMKEIDRSKGGWGIKDMLYI